MVNGCSVADKCDRCAAPPWTTASAEWQTLEQHLPADHLARRIARAVDRLDLSPLGESYRGVGKRALRPDSTPCGSGCKPPQRWPCCNCAAGRSS